MTQRTPYRYILAPDGIGPSGTRSLKFVKVRITGFDLPNPSQRGTGIQAKTTPETSRHVNSGTGMGIFRPKLLSV